LHSRRSPASLTGAIFADTPARTKAAAHHRGPSLQPCVSSTRKLSRTVFFPFFI
jgi:hypothetical protein